MSSSPFPSLPISGISFPHSPITIAAFEYTKQHTTEAVYNHCVRSAYWALLLVKKLAPLAAKKPDLETVVLSCVLHDMGWSFTKELLSTYKRFEVDGADIARDFVQGYEGEGKERWDEERVQRVWDVIAFHATMSIAPFGSAEVAAAHLGIGADFLGPRFPTNPWGDPAKLAAEPSAPGAVITVDEFREVLRAFPYAGFGAEKSREILCGLCRDKPVSTFDNFVSGFGREFGFDGKGGGRDEYIAMWNRANNPENITANFGYFKGLLEEEEEE